jgi:D-glycero-alpha-D-manno-heptose-7-phosphate kinase
LDISTFYYPLRHLFPCTVNIAINLRTKIRLLPYDKKRIKVTSKGFKEAEYLLDKAPFDHPLGLIFAIAAYFRAEGIHIDIDSSSPPRSALGGSSVAAVALVGAFSKVREKMGEYSISRKNIALLSQTIEASVAGVPCGFQDQLAAVYGGANSWYWPGDCHGPFFKKKTIIQKRHLPKFEQNLLLAYCGVPHKSKDVNRKWVKQFLSGKHHGHWAEIIECTQKFADALMERNIPAACRQMNKETAVRRRMTPEVLDDIGKPLVEYAKKTNCGARFTGAGGGGCIWALGGAEDIDKLKVTWEGILSTRKDARLLSTKIDTQGLL